MTHTFIVANLNQCGLQKETIRVFVTRSIDRSSGHWDNNTVMQSHIALLFLPFCVLRKNTAKSYSKVTFILRPRHSKYFSLTGRNEQVPEWRSTLNHFPKHCLPFCTFSLGGGRRGSYAINEVQSLSTPKGQFVILSTEKRCCLCKSPSAVRTAERRRLQWNELTDMVGVKKFSCVNFQRKRNLEDGKGAWRIILKRYLKEFSFEDWEVGKTGWLY